MLKLLSKVLKARRTVPVPTKMFTISVDGNISSGKSTLVSKLHEIFPQLPFRCSDVEIIPEPLDKWCNLRGHNLLAEFYKDPVGNNFMFQHYVQLTRLQDTVRNMQKSRQVTKPGLHVRLMERSLQNNRHCFVELARARGELKDVEYAVLVEWYTWLEKNLDLKLDIIIYLRTDPERVYARMKSRGRTEESTVPLEYLTSLHQAYEDWLINPSNPAKENERSSHELIVVDANQGKEEVLAQAKALLLERLKKNAPEFFTSVNSM